MCSCVSYLFQGNWIDRRDAPAVKSNSEAVSINTSLTHIPLARDDPILHRLTRLQRRGSLLATCDPGHGNLKHAAATRNV